ncbi:hypothetical protein G7046_g4480 [Stylonectria norvegica]|nr:hypothetical protein G7046_g4480 [Stylonectria norvegica]
MFCSSLRRRQDWAPAIPALLGTGPSHWKEALLNTHDVAFPMRDHVGHSVVFRLLLLSTLDVDSRDARSRVERLSVLDGGKHAAIILLLSGKDAVTALNRLQMHTSGDVPVPIIPISSARELPTCLESLRRQCLSNNCPGAQTSEENTSSAIISHCVGGKPLSRDQRNVLAGISTGFTDIANQVLLTDGQSRMMDFLGDTDGARIISFFTDGPTSADS